MGSGLGGVTFWGGDLGFVIVNFQEGGGGAHRVPQTGNSEYDQSSEGRDLERRSSGKGTQISGNTYTGDVH